MLKIENLSVAVQGRQILHDINLHIKPGRICLPCTATDRFDRDDHGL